VTTLQNRNIVITGAGRGLGLAVARRIGAAGARVKLADVDPTRGAEAEKAMREEGLDAHFVPMDVTDAASVERAVAAVLDDGPVYGLVNNAGLAEGVGGRRFHEITLEDWDRLMLVNSRGPWLVSRAVVPSMIETGVGRIVNISSDSSLYGSPRLAHYVASKGALNALTRAMAREVGDDGVTVNAVAPGLTVSESASRVPEERHELYRRNRAISRDQTPEDLVGTVAFLLGPESAYVTGQLIVVNGGFVFA